MDFHYFSSKTKKKCLAKNPKGKRLVRGRPWLMGRCANHGGLSTGPKTKEGRERIAQAIGRARVLNRTSFEPSSVVCLRTD